MKLSDADQDREQRLYKRFKVPPGGMIGRLNDEQLVDIVDLSAGGVALRAGSRLSVGREYYLRLHDRKHSVDVRGTVIRSRVVERKQGLSGQWGPVYAAAMRLQEGLEDRITDFICEALLV